MTMAFPTLFPDGAGDFHQARLRKVELGQYFQHLLRFRGGRFAQHRRFPWFAFNTLQRARSRSQSKIFIKQQHDAEKLTAADIQIMLQEGDQQLVSKMLRYAAKLRGTRAFWLARRHELMDMIRAGTSPHAFFTLSAADLQWPDLHRHMPNSVEEPTNDPRVARQRRRIALNKNPHIAAAYLDQRLLVYFKHFLVPLLGVEHFWYRYEWQERGSGHIHGFLWLKDAPNPDEINFDLLKKADIPIPDEQQDKINNFTAYWNRIITASSPFPRQDYNMPLIGDHPCSIPRENLKNTKQELADLLNWVETHTKCVAGYCLVNRKLPGQQQPQPVCRFDYPMLLRENAGIAMDSKHRLRFEPRRNDRLLNPYNTSMILGWRANIDIKPVLSKYAAIDYIAKYASKSEKQAPAFPELLANVTSSMDGEGTAQTACQKMLNKMLGERTYSAQETAHLLLGIPLVRASATFKTVYIGPDGSNRELAVQDPDAELAAGGGEDENLVTDDSWIQRYMNRSPEMEALSLQDVLTKYSWRKSKWCTKRDKTKTVLRVYPRFSPNPEDEHYEDYCRTKVILHHPFRDLNTIHDPDDQLWAEIFAHCRASEHVHPKDTLRYWEEENREQDEDDEEDEELLNPDVQEMEEADWQTWAALHPNHDIPLYGVHDLGRRPVDDGWDIEASRAKWNDVNLLSTWIDEQKREAHEQEGPPLIDIDTLEGEQRAILDEYVDAYRRILQGEKPPQVLLNIDGTAGCGKTYLISAICQELRKMADAHEELNPIVVLAPSGVAALNIRGRTIHSALCLPINCAFSRLTGARLAALQVQWAGIHFAIIDEKSMVGQRTLAMIDSRLRQVLPRNSDIPFANINLALVGDFAQLPPVGDTPLYSPPSSAHTDNGELGRAGSVLYRLIAKSYHLRIIHRQLGDSPEQIQFRNLLRHASQGALNRQEWEFLDARNERKLTPDVRKLFDDATCLYTTRSDVHNLNLTELQALNEPCARIDAIHDGGPDATKALPDEAGGLEPRIILAKRAKVMITRNIWQNQGKFLSLLTSCCPERSRRLARSASLRRVAEGNKAISKV
jgi:ATP-dependent DNA helicase PIF1